MKSSALLFAAVLLCASRLSADTVDPTVVSASVTPISVDITGAQQLVTVSFHITDDDSGVHYGNAYLYDPSGKFVTLEFFGDGERTSGTALDGTYSVDLTVPRYSEPGEWRVDAFVRDNDGNQVDFNPNAMAFPDPPAMKFMVASSDPIDQLAPVLDAISVTPGTVDVTSQHEQVTFTIEVSDDLSEFDFGFVTLTVQDQTGSHNIDSYLGGGERVSGDALSGIYEVSMTIPQGTVAGTWPFHISIKDKAGNEYRSVEDGTLTIISTPPSIVPNFLAQAVDAVQLPWSSAGGGWVIQSEDSYDGTDAAANLPIPDDGTATLETHFEGPGELSFQWRVESEENSDYLSYSIDGGPVVESISGNTSWNQVFVVLPAGPHTVTWTYAKDSGGSDGNDRGWVDEVRFLADTDEALPVLQSLEISPRLAEISGGDVDVDFTISATDDSNGILEGRIELFDPNGNPQVSTTFDSGSNSGDSLDSHWQVTLPVAGTGQHGLWRAEIELTEQNSNATRLFGEAGDPFPAKRVEYFYVGDPSDADTDAPLVQEISVTPGTVDVTNGTTTAIVTVQITDSVRGFFYGYMNFNNPSDDRTGSIYFDGSNRVSGDKFNGIYQVEIPVPAYGNPGTWTLEPWVSDEGGNIQEYPEDIAFPVDLDPTFQVVNSGVADVTPPVITSIDIAPGTVDTSGAPAQIQFTVAIEDDLSDIVETYAFFYGPGDVYYGSLFTNFIGDRISGDDQSGVYQFSRTLPQGSAVGQWRVYILLRDKAGNDVYYGENAADYPDSGDGYFTVSGAVQSVFASYVAGFGLTGNDALVSADPDHDGMNNATETLLGSNPAEAASNGVGLISNSRDATHFYLNFTVATGLTATVDGDFLELGNGSGGAPLRLTGQTQGGLTGAWTDVLPQPVSGQNYRIAIPLSSGPKGFARLFFEDP